MFTQSGLKETNDNSLYQFFEYGYMDKNDGYVFDGFRTYTTFEFTISDQERIEEKYESKMDDPRLKDR